MYQILLAYNIHKNKRTLVFHFLFYLKNIKDMESKSTSGVSSTCSNPCTTPVGNTVDDMAYLCSWNLLSFLLQRITDFLEKYKRSLIFDSAYKIRITGFSDYNLQLLFTTFSGLFILISVSCSATVTVCS